MKLTLEDNKVIKQHFASLPLESFEEKRVLNAIISHESHVITSAKFFSFIASTLFIALPALVFIPLTSLEQSAIFLFSAASDNTHYSGAANDRKGCWILTSNDHESEGTKNEESKNYNIKAWLSRRGDRG